MDVLHIMLIVLSGVRNFEVYCLEIATSWT